MMELIKKHAEKVRFLFIGGINTAFDFILLFSFVALGVNSVAANYLSTSIAFLLSFFLNKNFTFKSTTGNVKKQFVLFILVTIIGLWVIQPIVIFAITALLAPFSWGTAIVLFIAKLIATVASLIWNYIFYSRLVFKKEA